MEFKRNEFKGQNCFILGNGNSLNSFDLSKLKGRFVIGANRILRCKEVTPDIICVSDHNGLNHNWRELVIENERTIKKGLWYVLNSESSLSVRTAIKAHVDNSRLKWISHKLIEPFLDETFSHFPISGNGVVRDLCIPTAWYLGFKEIYLLGVEGRFGSHFYEHPGAGCTNAHNDYRSMLKILESKVNVYNCLQDPSRAPEIPKIFFKKALDRT